MATVKRIADLRPYATVLPYASEMFGIFQPILGWKSRRIMARFHEGFRNDRRAALERLTRQFAGLVEITRRDNNELDIKISEGVLRAGALRAYDSVVLERLSVELPSHDQYDPSVWSRVITRDRLDHILQTDVVKTYSAAHAELRRGAGGDAVFLRSRGRSRRDAAGAGAGGAADGASAAIERQLQYESSVAGAVHLLAESKAHAALEEVFYASRDKVENATAIARALSQGGETGLAFLDLSNLNPQDQEDIQSAVLSPVGVVHLFRQYFFELDTFLGTPEKHVWLSPGSSVELIEVHTRRALIEKTLETALEILTSSEKSTTQQDDISEAVKEDNSNDTKFGTSLKARYGSIEATASFDYSASQKSARETTHKRMRQQTEKLSTQIRRNFKSTFKTTTEVTDVSSTRHLLANSTDSLLNYELRRKMRQVGVQVQDIGTFLCWQAYVDDPGHDLGLAKLLHVAKPAEMGGIPHPEELPLLQPFVEEKSVTIPFLSVDNTGADRSGEVYINGVELEEDESFGDQERIEPTWPQSFVAPKANVELTNVEFTPGAMPVQVSISPIVPNGDRFAFDLHLDYVDFQGKSALELPVFLHWSPTKAANDAIIQKNRDNLAAFKEAERAEYEKSYVESVRERVTMASKIAPRDSEDLREEERIVVYRRLVQDMLLQGVPMPDDRTRHVVAEVINSMFDVDKMLYFVAPEWWRPRLHRSKQQIPEMSHANLGPLAILTNPAVRKGLMKWIGGPTTPANPLDSSTVGWGGVNDRERDNYFITDESEPAPFGSSLGWLLQLDGDSMRNAFLNAPWVKAVIPIRPGREEAAINWLKGVEGMNGITDDVIYHSANPDERDIDGNPTDGQKMIDVLMNLGRKIRAKYEDGIESGLYPKVSDVSDPTLVDNENTVTATPIDRVYEHGFFPLKGGFRANVGGDYEIFDQWTEILPTDQIVPVEVKYDPKTGRQL